MIAAGYYLFNYFYKYKTSGIYIDMKIPSFSLTNLENDHDILTIDELEDGSIDGKIFRITLETRDYFRDENNCDDYDGNYIDILINYANINAQKFHKIYCTYSNWKFNFLTCSSIP